MGQRSSADIEVWITDGNGRESDTPAGVLAELAGVLNINGVSTQQLTEEGYAYGDTFVFFEPVGIDRVGDIQMTMFLDDTPASGNYALFAQGSRYRTFKVRYSTDAGEAPNRLFQKMDVVIQNVNITANKGEKIKLEISLQPNSSMTTDWE